MAVQQVAVAGIDGADALALAQERETVATQKYLATQAGKKEGCLGGVQAQFDRAQYRDEDAEAEAARIMGGAGEGGKPAAGPATAAVRQENRDRLRRQLEDIDAQEAAEKDAAQAAAAAAAAAAAEAEKKKKQEAAQRAEEERKNKEAIEARKKAAAEAKKPDKPPNLHSMVLLGDRDGLRAAVGAGADILAANERGMTPAHAAAAQGDALSLSLLLDCGAPIAAVTPEKKTLLMCAAEVAAEACTELLLARGADLKAQDKDLAIALHYACRADAAVNESGCGCIRLLLEKGGPAQANAQEDFGNTPLHAAAANGSAAAVRMLLAVPGVIKEPKTKIGDTPQKMAKSAGHKDVAALFGGKKAGGKKAGGKKPGGKK